MPNIQDTLAERDLESWTPVPRPREFQQFQVEAELTAIATGLGV
jgi:hypothetical protein